MKWTLIALVGSLSLIGCQRSPVSSQPDSVPRPSDIATAIRDFQTKQGARFENNYAVPRKLLPLLKPGLSQGDVREILGEPSSVSTNDLGICWIYGLFYSQFIEIRFSPDGTVKKVTSTVESR